MEANTSQHQDSAGVHPEEIINLDELEIDDPQFFMKMDAACDQSLEALREIALEEVTWDRLNTNLDLVSAISPDFITHMSWLTSVLQGDSHQGTSSPEPAPDSLGPSNTFGSS